MSALHDVQGDTINVESRAAWHSGRVAQIEPGPLNHILDDE
jgi:hypothetical protein